MDILVWLAIGAIVWFAITHFIGKPDFWKATRKHPDLAWRFFNNHPAWFINAPPPNLDVVGPFRVTNPITGELTKIWCDVEQIEKSQGEFMALVQEKTH
jgi:hypothetical protein